MVRYFMTLGKKFLTSIVGLLSRVILATLRLQLEDHSGFTVAPPSFPVIITFWHDRIFAVALAFLRKYPACRRGIFVLASPSRDGEILAAIMAAFRIGTVRGSSSRRGSQALLELTTKLQQGFDIAITPDGPRGPRYYLRPGPLFLASTTEARILPVHAYFSHAITLRSWDRFRIPLPFSRVGIVIAPYEMVAKGSGEGTLEAERARIEALLKNGAD
ncbi:MAG: lysophospholipid acyltransferase family protein [Candidatus Xiphinematobacter sp.]|nr:MAG: lysophospholipid acyltransferase family protein [Candidatus Xiphinematobacter sp.]QQY11432.1 MAG: lysophospholipid acyltransferase family protein [Candidatus Xiphinematobacter sp.]